MENLGYFERILAEYEKTFDIYKDYHIQGEKFKAYGFFNSHSEKYLLVKEVQLWETKAFEHLFLSEKDIVTIEELNKILSLIPNYIEPQLIRKGEKYPEKNHMYSFITLVIFSKNIQDSILIEKIKKYKFEKNYLFSIRGYTQVRLLLVDTEKKTIFTNKAGKKLEKLYKHFINKN